MYLLGVGIIDFGVPRIDFGVERVDFGVAKAVVEVGVKPVELFALDDCEEGDRFLLP